MNEAFKHKIFTNDIKIKRALISVTDKKGIDILAKELASLNIEILSTGGTAKFLEENGISVKDVSKETEFPEILDGRVKTLHPIIHAGILAKSKKDLDKLKKNVKTDGAINDPLYVAKDITGKTDRYIVYEGNSRLAVAMLFDRTGVEGVKKWNAVLMKD